MVKREEIYRRMDGLPWYLLKHRKPVRVAPEKWLGQLEDFKTRRVRVKYWGDKAMVSTVFLGLAHGMAGDEPVVFETMVVIRREGRQDQFDIFGRATKWRAALIMHRRAVEYVKGFL